MWCVDKSLTYLAGLGYNVIRYPSADCAPLKLLGKQNGEFQLLGGLNQLITQSTQPLPVVELDQSAADINGRSSSSLKIGIGANILGGLIGAMGGTLSASLQYTNATDIEFQYVGVTIDSTMPLDAGNYLRGAHVDSANPVLDQYILGNGDLFLITRIAKSQKFSVKYTKSGGAEADVSIPVIQQVASGKVSVTKDNTSASTLTFEGPVALPFAFQCFHIGLENGKLDMAIEKAGKVYGFDGAALASNKPQSVLFVQGLLEVKKPS